MKLTRTCNSWVAAALGPLQMSAVEAIQELSILSKTVFDDGNQCEEGNARFRVSTLRRSIESLLQRREKPVDIKMSSFKHLSCKT